MGIKGKIVSGLERIPLFRHAPTRQFIKFAIVGVANTALDIGLFTLLHAWGLHYLLANVFAFSAGVINSYYWNRRWTFRSRQAKWGSEMIKFFTVSGIGFAGNELLLLLLVELGHWLPLAAKLIVTIVIFFWNYLANRLWTFKNVSLPS